MPLTATMTVLAFTFLGDATQIELFLYVLNHPRNGKEATVNRALDGITYPS
jgi:hypothetical protein